MTEGRVPVRPPFAQTTDRKAVEPVKAAIVYDPCLDPKTIIIAKTGYLDTEEKRKQAALLGLKTRLLSGTAPSPGTLHGPDWVAPPGTPRGWERRVIAAHAGSFLPFDEPVPLDLLHGFINSQRPDDPFDRRTVIGAIQDIGRSAADADPHKDPRSRKD
jgi:hypothetical protein